MTKFTSHYEIHQSEATESATAQARMDVNQSSKCYLGSAHSVIDDNRNFRFSDVIANMADVVIRIFHRRISLYLLIQAPMTSGMHLHLQTRKAKWCCSTTILHLSGDLKIPSF
ncbi:uncharacterized protein NPIL_530341 [Nephila pilipes]|uniref:Uncharacterized protein n=1 Tax=Nephila pilipes TaxID=299642 RepID=A0A8X6MQW8_NEPPI|nr:uncharacterized protein NPIL_530341 [Nephila pilipes]